MSNLEKKLESDPEKILLTAEKWWRARYELLQKRGYRLHARYQPDWQPSWLTSGERMRCEDNYRNKVCLYLTLIYH